MFLFVFQAENIKYPGCASYLLTFLLPSEGSVIVFEDFAKFDPRFMLVLCSVVFPYIKDPDSDMTHDFLHRLRYHSELNLRPSIQFVFVNLMLFQVSEDSLMMISILIS
jgi:hypothetical protein